ncbi:MAG: cytochrome c3 family protein [Candidatus Eisenbacteria bacterium]|nr:cytochrome c3 family protein [Candidatus Eisenbacteria bacterium]
MPRHQRSRPAGKHKGADLATLNCSGCHQPHGSEGKGLLATKRHAPFEGGECGVCHGEGTPGPMPAPLTDACGTCHGEITAPAAAGETVHAPVESGECAVCHNPHAAERDKLLQKAEADLCRDCHEDQFTGGSSHHPPFEDGKCSGCHDPHRSMQAGLLKKPGKELCGECHQPFLAKLEGAKLHDPVAKDRCDACHNPHGSNEPALLLKPMGELCASCHAVTPALKEKHKGYPLNADACLSCHDPHASKELKLMQASTHAPFAQGNCTACHNPAGGLKATGQAQCTLCHSKVKEEMARPVKHPAMSDGEACLNCHSPHAGAGPSLMKSASEITVCGECHDPAMFRGKSSHLDKTPNCAACHDPHGGENAKLLKASPEQVCLSCHESGEKHNHPLGADFKDPRTDGPLTCLSCHNPHASQFDYMLTADRRRDLCVECHAASH